MKGLYIILLLIVVCTSACKKTVEPVTLPYHASCDFETVVEHDGKDVFKGDGDYFNKTKGRSSKFSRSGDYSLRLDKITVYGGERLVGELKKGAHVEASIWRKYNPKGKGALVMQDVASGIYWATSNPIKRVGDWELLYIEAVLPEDLLGLKIYAYSPHEEPRYFDDLDVWVDASKKLPEFENVLDINISDKNWSKIESYRRKAMKQGQITKDLKKYVNAEIKYEGTTIPVEMRIKGDWTDHLSTHKWSFRIKVKGDNAFQGMTTFSIQSPHTRDFMNEWFSHKLFEREGILTTKYFFIPVRLNGELMGQYAVEEHFVKQLVESQQRREGPIVKYNEEGFWQSMNAAKKQKSIRMPFYQASEVLPFSAKKTVKSPSLKSQFVIAQGLLSEFKSESVYYPDNFDLDYVARYYALFDLANSYHGMAWHNQRFYYNPVTAKLEQIAYDLFEETGHHKQRRPILGIIENNTKLTIDKYINYQFFGNEEFNELYKHYLRKYSDPSYLEEVYAEFEDEINSIEKLLVAEYRMYSFEEEFFVSNAKKIAAKVEEYKTKKFPEFVRIPEKPFEAKRNEDALVKPITLQAFVQDTIGDQLKLGVYNYHIADVEIVGYSLAKQKDTVRYLDKSALKGFVTEADYVEFMVPKKTRRLHFAADNTGNKVHRVQILKWPEPKKKTIHQEFKEFAMTPEEAGMRINDNDESISFKSSTIVIDKPLLIPKGYTWLLREGTKIDLIKGASIVSYSPIITLGKGKKIEIGSSDSTGQGLLVLNAKDTSYMADISFKNLSNFNFKGWAQTGAVTFYQSPVILEGCSFSSNRCEDALNLVRCDFKMNDCRFTNIFADAFDSDFSVGKLYECIFNKVGNDAVDVSGSNVMAMKCKVSNVGDKGFSGGENSYLTVVLSEISKCNIAVASKDMSSVMVQNGCTIEDCNLAFAVYRKKPEFGRAYLSADAYSLKSIKQESLVDINSELTLKME